MNEYTEDKDYGQIDSKPPLCLGISFYDHTPGSSYKYSLRFNSSRGPRSEIVNTLNIFPRTDPLKMYFNT